MESSACFCLERADYRRLGRLSGRKQNDVVPSAIAEWSSDPHWATSSGKQSSLFVLQYRFDIETSRLNNVPRLSNTKVLPSVWSRLTHGLMKMSKSLFEDSSAYLAAFLQDRVFRSHPDSRANPETDSRTSSSLLVALFSPCRKSPPRDHVHARISDP